MTSITVHDKTSYSFAQSPHEHLVRMPATVIAVAPSNSGKSTWLMSLLMDPEKYGAAWTDLLVCSPSLGVDKVWEPLKREVKRRNLSEDEVFHSSWDAEKIGARCAEHGRKVQALKDKSPQATIPLLLLIVDDFADQPAVMKARGQNLLDSICIKGRHSGIGTILSVQTVTSLSTVARKNARAWLVGRFNSAKEEDVWSSEISAILPKKLLLEVLRAATSERYSFLYVNMTSHSLNETFWLRLERPFVFE
jgi:hypothetical protein